MKVRFFGRLSELAATDELDAPAAMVTVAEIIDWIAGERPALAEALRQPTVKAIVDDVFASAATPLNGADELAFLPPVSGG